MDDKNLIEQFIQELAGDLLDDALDKAEKEFESTPEEEKAKIEAYMEMANATYEAVEKSTDEDERLDRHAQVICWYIRNYFRDITKIDSDGELYFESVDDLIAKIKFIATLCVLTR